MKDVIEALDGKTSIVSLLVKTRIRGIRTKSIFGTAVKNNEVG